MKLSDFTEFGPFNALRDKMGATRLGYFELFNPRLHLTGVERSELVNVGMTVPRQGIAQLIDFTLSYKNSRVAVISAGYLHISRCKSLPESTELFITTNSKVVKEYAVCRECLQKLHYEGYDSTKARRESYSHQVAEQFSLEQFWQQYKLYPVSEKKEPRRALDEL